jgi:hypothetical protein
MATAVNGWLLAYDNISAIPDWLSDSLCQLVFGGGVASRTLFSNSERSVIHAQRPVILNGIEDFVRRGDLTDRTVFLHLPPILPTTRRAEDDFWSSFHADYPRILGGVLNAVAGGLNNLPSIHLPESPRMADYAKWGEAVGQGLGWPSESFLWTYNDNRREATLMALEDSALGSVLLRLQSAKFSPMWAGSAAELHAETTKWAGMKLANSARWPKTLRAFSNELRRVVPMLFMHGIAIHFLRKRDKRLIVIAKVGGPIVTPSYVTHSPVNT